MKNYFKILGLGAAIATVSTLTSCHDDQILSGGEGTVMVRATVNTDVRVKSRAISDELGDSCLIHIYNNKGLVRRYKGINSVPAEGIKLTADHYVAEAWTGDSVSASFDARWFKGREEFDVSRGQTTLVNLTCKIANVVAAVNYDDNIDEFMSDYSITVEHSRGKLEFEGRDDRWGYFMMPSTDTDLTWTLAGTLANGEAYSRTGTLADVKPATLYTLHVVYSEGEGAEIGGGYITIEVDETALEVNEEIEIAVAPIMLGVGFDLRQPMIAEAGKVGRQEITVAASSALTSFILESDELPGLLGINGTEIDLFNAVDEDALNSVRTAGVEWIYKYYDQNDCSTMNLIFGEALLNSLGDGTHAFNLTAVDANGKVSKRTFTIDVTNADVKANEAADTDVWATSATLTGRILKESATNPGFMYRAVGTQSWTATGSSDVNGSAYSARITGLTPGTEYEFIAVADGYTSSDVLTFTTEGAFQLPNSDFEDWHTDGKVVNPWVQGGSQFWDSGNKGATTLGNSITTQATDKKHSGNSSARLGSEFKGIGSLGKFAAGNIFVGKYLATKGTNGVLGWGREWNSRPTKLTGWYHYTPATITDASDNFTSLKGQMDQAIIYIAILDDTMDEFEGSSFPVIVDTRDPENKLFKKDAANVIAYGELVVSDATQGDEMQPFSIELNYVRNDRKASNIMVVASASRYGDYFTGGYSVLYIDDLNLEY